MGKKSKKHANGAKGADKSGADMPMFDENALTALTARIEKDFGKKTKDDTPVNITNGDRKEGGKMKPKANGKNSEPSRGIKRDARGIAKPLAKHEKKSKPGSKAQETNGAQKDDKAILLAEILALGGTEEDLELVADAFSDDEEANTGSEAAPDKSFKKDLAAFVAGLGIEGAVTADDEEPEVEDDEEEDEADDGWEEAGDDDESLVEAPELVAGPMKKTPTTAVLNAAELNDPNRLTFQARPDWHAAPLADLPSPVIDEASRYRDAMANLKTYAKTLLEADGNLYSSKHLSASSSHRFLSTIMTSGTLSDKVSALTLVIQESPVHTTKSFESLLTLAKKHSRGQAVTALGALKDLLGQGVVLPADRRLRTFAAQPGLLGTLQETSISTWHQGQALPGAITKAHLISWAYEDWLKEAYFDMLKVLEGWCSDEVEYARSRAVTYVYELLKEKPEQEANLLRLLVNKLGDPDKKISSRTSYLLLQLQVSHPLMKPIIIHSIENELLLRPGQSQHAKYYAINTLNQTILSGKEEQVAKKLLGIYFELFVSLLKKPEPKPQDAPVVNRKGQIQGGGAPMGKKAKAKATKEEEAKLANEETTEKMISAVLTGVNRAFPFSKSDDLTLEKHMDTLFRITHSSNFNTSIQALMLIEQLATSKHLSVDRFYRTLYESLLDPRLVTSSKHALYLNLLYRALKADLNIKRVKAFVKRMLQVVTLHQPPFICGILFLVKELEAVFPGLKSLFSDPEEDGTEDEVFRDVPEDGEAEVPTMKQSNHTAVYDGRKRDPEHSNADKSCLWDILPFLVHFHPSVSLFASRLLNDEKMPPKPDLASHTLSSFLDRFVYRNAKASSGAPRGGSIMQPLSGSDSKGVLISNKSSAHMQGPLNTEAFWKKKAEDVAVDEVFFHKYFSQIGKGKKDAGKKKEKKAAESEEDGEGENEDEIWEALVSSRPEVEGPSDDESDMEMLDLDESDAELSDADDIEINMDDDDDDDDDEENQEAEGSAVADSDGFVDEDESGDGGVGLDEDSEADSDIDELFAKELETAKTTEPGEGKKETSRQKKKKLKGLPTFASVEDYASMLDNDEDEDF